MGTYYDKIGTWNDTYCIKMFKTSSFPLARCIMGDAEWVLFPNCHRETRALLAPWCHETEWQPPLENW